jgi:hypothetical protein
MSATFSKLPNRLRTPALTWLLSTCRSARNQFSDGALPMMRSQEHLVRRGLALIAQRKRGRAVTDDSSPRVLSSPGSPLPSLIHRLSLLSSEPSLVEVYPLAALVGLMRKRKRPGYKVSKTLTYWPGRSKSDRLKLLLNSWHEIIVALQGEVGYLGFEPPRSFTSFASLKPYEDMLDAIICCWIGACFSEGAAEPFGDSDAAIWIPRAG